MTGNALSGLAVIETITGGETPKVVLSQTVFHPQGGGQKADTGRLCFDINVRLADYAREGLVLSAEAAAVAVTDVQYAEDRTTVLHTVDEVAHLTPGMTVMMQVDADSRSLHSRLHSAGHLLADIVEQLSPGLVATAAHHWPAEARVEFAGEAANLPALETRIREGMSSAIRRDLPINVDADADGVRTVSIGGGARIPCGGTHASRTSELFGFRLKSIAAKKGRIRLSYDVLP